MRCGIVHVQSKLSLARKLHDKRVLSLDHGVNLGEREILSGGCYVDFLRLQPTSLTVRFSCDVRCTGYYKHDQYTRIRCRYLSALSAIPAKIP